MGTVFNIIQSVPHLLDVIKSELSSHFLTPINYLTSNPVQTGPFLFLYRKWAAASSSVRTGPGHICGLWLVNHCSSHKIHVPRYHPA